MIVPLQDPTPFSPVSPEAWREGLADVRAGGFDGVELAITNPCLLEPAAVAETLVKESLRLLSITTGQAAAKESLSLSSRDKDVRRRAIARIQSHMELAEPYGAVVIVGSLRGRDGDLALLEDSLRACADHRNVRLALEPLNRYESGLLNTVAEARETVDRVDRENLGLLYDTFHANIEEASPVESLRVAGDRLMHVHLADSNRWVPGYGHIRFGEIWEALEEIGYARAVVLEPLPLPGPDALLGAGEAIRRRWNEDS